MATVTTTNSSGDFLSFYLSNPDPNALISSLNHRSWKAEAKDTNDSGFLLFYYNKKRIIQKRKEKSTMRKEFTPFINLFSESATVGFWVYWFFWISLLLCFPIWLCWFFCFLFFFFFTGFDGHGGIVVVQWFLWDWWLLRWCVGSWIKYYFIVDVFVGSVIYYFIVMFILFYCVKS